MPGTMVGSCGNGVGEKNVLVGFEMGAEKQKQPKCDLNFLI